jgi:hypothetical protein
MLGLMQDSTCDIEVVCVIHKWFAYSDIILSGYRCPCGENILFEVHLWYSGVCVTGVFSEKLSSKLMNRI